KVIGKHDRIRTAPNGWRGKGMTLSMCPRSIFADRTSAVVVTKDEDFAVRVQLQTTPGPAVVWIRWGNLRTSALLERCGPLWPSVVDAVAGGERLIELA
ncbi:MAG: hypothetical protein QM736_00310, partial [Vicinamibacterales bacterium]